MRSSAAYCVSSSWSATGEWATDGVASAQDRSALKGLEDASLNAPGIALPYPEAPGGLIGRREADAGDLMGDVVGIVTEALQCFFTVLVHDGVGLASIEAVVAQRDLGAVVLEVLVPLFLDALGLGRAHAGHCRHMVGVMAEVPRRVAAERGHQTPSSPSAEAWQTGLAQVVGEVVEIVGGVPPKASSAELRPPPGIFPVPRAGHTGAEIRHRAGMHDLDRLSVVIVEEQDLEAIPLVAMCDPREVTLDLDGRSIGAIGVTELGGFWVLVSHGPSNTPCHSDRNR